MNATSPGPSTLLHARSRRPSGRPSSETDPSRCALEPRSTPWSGPASTTGGWFGRESGPSTRRWNPAGIAPPAHASTARRACAWTESRSFLLWLCGTTVAAQPAARHALVRRGADDQVDAPVAPALALAAQEEVGRVELGVVDRGAVTGRVVRLVGPDGDGRAREAPARGARVDAEADVHERVVRRPELAPGRGDGGARLPRRATSRQDGASTEPGRAPAPARAATGLSPSTPLASAPRSERDGSTRPDGAPKALRGTPIERGGGRTRKATRSCAVPRLTKPRDHGPRRMDEMDESMRFVLRPGQRGRVGGPSVEKSALCAGG